MPDPFVYGRLYKLDSELFSDQAFFDFANEQKRVCETNDVYKQDDRPAKEVIFNENAVRLSYNLR